MESEKTIIEVNGVKLEVDMRTARRIEEIRIGSPVKLLTKVTYGGNKVHPGIVISFEPFKDLPYNPSRVCRRRVGRARKSRLRPSNSKQEGIST